MSQSASQANAFYRDVARIGKVWTIRDAHGFPGPKTPDGARAVPFWSSLARAERIVSTVRVYKGFAPLEISWLEFRDTWLPALERDGLKVGLNWSGRGAIGYDREPSSVRQSVEAVEASERSSSDPANLDEGTFTKHQWKKHGSRVMTRISEFRRRIGGR